MMILTAHAQGIGVARATRAARSHAGGGALVDRMTQLQRAIGNAAVADMLAVQRCGGTPCGCPEDVQREELAALQPLAGNQAVSDLALQRKNDGGAEAADGGPACGGSAECPPPFCTPFSSQTVALAVRASTENVLLAGIAAKVSPRVAPLWFIYLHGGSPPLELSNMFGEDFTESKTTRRVTDFLMGELAANLVLDPPVFAPGATETTINLATRLGNAMTTDLSESDGPRSMNFNEIGEIPGNIAGGIGKDQLSCQVGAQPSPFNDDRRAAGTARVTRNPDGTLTVVPSITFTVRDTIDLCPGNCGAAQEKIATVPLSRMEASGIAGDVPFTVRFPAPPRSLTVTPAPSLPAPGPAAAVPGRTVASSLRIREGPSTSSPVVGFYPKGTSISILCQTEGTSVEGNSTWDQTDRGFVSDRFVRRLDPVDPPDCGP